MQGLELSYMHSKTRGTPWWPMSDQLGGRRNETMADLALYGMVGVSAAQSLEV